MSPNPVPLPLEPLLTTTEVAAVLEIAPGTLENWRVQGKGPPYLKLYGHVRYSPTAVQAWVEAQTRRHTSDPGPAAITALRPGGRRHG